MISRAIALGAVLALAGCNTIDATDIKTFGDAATAIAAAAQDARNIDNRIGAEIATENQATRFMRVDDPYQFPPKIRPTLAVGTVWDIRIAYAQALANYGNALAAAASGVSGDGIETAVDNLQTATTTAVPGLSKMKNFPSISTAAGKVATTVITMAAYERIHKAVVRAHPFIVKGRQILGGDFADVAMQVDQRYDNWLEAKASSLDAIRGASSASEKYAAYHSFLQDESDMRDAVSLLVATKGAKPEYVSILDKMVAAHAALAEAKPNSLSVASFAAAAQQFQAISDLFQKEQTQ